MLVALACAAVLVGPPTVEGPAALIDRDTAREGIVVRVGSTADDWHVQVGPSTQSRVVVTMTAPDGWVLEREVSLDATDPDARGRQLAAAVATVIDNYEPRPEASPAEAASGPSAPASERPRPSGWIGVGGALSSGPVSRAALAPGVTLGGGAWLLRDHLQPIAEAGWRRSSAGALTVDGVRLGAGALAGGALARGHLWLGAGAIVGALGGFARAQRNASGWAASVTAPLSLQARLGRVLLELNVGPEITLPPLRFRGEEQTLRWGHLRVFAGLRVGLLFGDTKRFGFRGSGPV